MPNKDEKHVRIQIVISLLTLIITPVLSGVASGVVVWYQLSKRHQFWVQQRELIKADDTRAARIRLLNDLNSSYLDYLGAADKYSRNHIRYVELLARREFAEDTKILFFDTALGLRPSREEYESAGKEIAQWREDYEAARKRVTACLGAVVTANEFSSDVAQKAMIASQSIGLSGPDIPQLNELSQQYMDIMKEFRRTKDLGKYIESVVEFRDTSLLLRDEDFCIAMKELFKLMCAESIER